VVATKHIEDCQCTYCTGFLPGHQLSVGHGAPVQHGAYVSPLRLAGRVEEICEVLRDSMAGYYTSSFEAAVQAAAIPAARLERALERLETAKPSEYAKLEADARGWHRAWVAGLGALGLTPMAASRLGLNLALAGGSAHEALLKRYGPQSGGQGS
jgi:hypothetical protein